MNIVFSEIDTAIIFSIPKSDVGVSEIIRYYCFVNRDAPPPFEALRGCLSKALDAGIIRQNENGTFRIDEIWFRQIHQFENQCTDEIEAMLQFEGYLCSQEWPAIAKSHFELSFGDYQRAVPQTP